MNRGDEGRRDESEHYDPDMRLPPAVLHFFPVVLALFILTMSVAGHSVFFGFEEDEPITWMSLSLMLTVLVFLLAVIRDPELESDKRWAAIVLAAVAGFALLDERERWHEAFGKWVKDELDVFTRDVRHYTDDAVVIVFALAGTLLFLFFLRKLARRRELLPYVACAAALALAHGVLDVLGHGGRLWRALIPEITKHQVALLTDVLSVYEEACKLWAEWFVLLFVLRFFYGQRGPLAWSMLVMIGSFLSAIGLWAIEDPSAGVPYVVMEDTLRILRNYHLLIALGAVFSIWAVASWRLFGDRPEKQALAGLFFLAPFYAALPEIASFSKLAGQPLLLLSIGGVLLPLSLALLVRRGDVRIGALLGALVLASALLRNPLGLLVAYGFVLALAIARLTSPVSAKAWSALLVSQALVIAIVFRFSASGILPEYRFEVLEKVVFETGIQEIDPDYYRSDP